MKLSHKILLWIACSLVVGAFALIVYKQFEISKQQKVIESTVVLQKQLVDGIVRSQLLWITKEDFVKFIKDNNLNLKAIEEDLKKLQANINSTNIVVALSTGQSAVNQPSIPGGIINPNPIDTSNPDPYGYLLQQQTISLHENFENIKIPIGSVGFAAWQKNPWSYEIKGREYVLNTVIGTDENQRHYYYNKFSVRIDDKDYLIPIKLAEAKQIYPKSKFSFWNPRLYLTMGGSVNLSNTPIQGAFNAGASLGIMSYGKYLNNPDISALQLGVGVLSNESKLGVIFSPFNVNIAGIFPNNLVKNTYIGPSLQLDTNNNAFAGLNVSVGL
jgi:hypothetical protein